MIRPARHTPISQRFTSQANERSSSPCERLWREVIDLAFREAVQPPKVWYGVKNPRHLETLRTRLQHEARDWLLSGGQDFVTVCGKARRLNLPARVVSMAGHGRCPERGNAGYVSYRLKSERVVDACPRCAAEAETAYQQHQRAAYREAAE